MLHSVLQWWKIGKHETVETWHRMFKSRLLETDVEVGVERNSRIRFILSLLIKMFFIRTILITLLLIKIFFHKPLDFVCGVVS